MKATKPIALVVISIMLAATVSGLIEPAQVEAINSAVTCPFGIVTAGSTQRSTSNYRLNSFRSAVGLPSVSDIDQFSKEAQAHAMYLWANNDNSAVDPTTEDSSNPCYSNEGKTGAANGIIRPGNPWLGTSNNIASGTAAIDAIIDSPFDRLYLMDPRLTTASLGIVLTNNNDAKYVLNAKRVDTSRNFLLPSISTSPIVYPDNNFTGVPTEVGPGEFYEKISSLGLQYPIGYPITISFGPSVYTANGTAYSVSLYDISAALYIIPSCPACSAYQVATTLVQPGDGRYPSSMGNTITVIPNHPLETNTTYALTYSVGIAVKTTPSGGSATTNYYSIQNSVNRFDTVSNPTLAPTLPPAPQPSPTPGIPAMPQPQPTNPAPVGGGFFQVVQATFTNGQFFQQWRASDEAVLLGRANRSWTWGPQPYGFATVMEPYNGGQRVVAYHDKARMEAADATTGNITNGLLVREMVSGMAQVGDALYLPRQSALLTVAGDVAETNIDAPTYWSFYYLASLNNDRRAPNQTGQAVVATVSKDGIVNVNPGAAGYNAINVYYDNNLGHNIPQVFWDFMNNGTVSYWLPVFGLPITEAYWTQALVGGVKRDVLVQLFERRVLTFTPSNPDPFKVEMGNVGRHYFKWRYNINY